MSCRTKLNVIRVVPTLKLPVLRVIERCVTVVCIGLKIFLLITKRFRRCEWLHGRGYTHWLNASATLTRLPISIVVFSIRGVEGEQTRARFRLRLLSALSSSRVPSLPRATAMTCSSSTSDRSLRLSISAQEAAPSLLGACGRLDGDSLRHSGPLACNDDNPAGTAPAPGCDDRHHAAVVRALSRAFVGLT